ncbi:putative sensory transducer protein YfmS [Clostridium ragsdalei P11]|uniref:Putative sensory transducer protein YfmS n=1 Tax=Clostridium ragsdalei P11 TaxID=1353534 RepID=A0A1A6AMW2_9CLOT|nr:methyl-accepting chemotaxis protein [Clostridium ragsdalei]OBR91409.1 putative sensory transducer protein YfmS [Clostridium ragsdalei P11]
MISINELDCVKRMCESQAEMISGGVVYFITEKNKVVWKKKSKIFDMKSMDIGFDLSEHNLRLKALEEKKNITENISKSKYGALKIFEEPITGENGQVTGAFCSVFPKSHPVAKAFNNFAPILVEMFPEGAFFILSDLEKVTSVQRSEKFDIPAIKPGVPFVDNPASVVHKAIQTKKFAAENVDSLGKLGVPVRMATYPLCDEDTGDVVGTFGMIIPRGATVNLKNMSNDLTENITGVSSTIEELAASASEIHTNEQNLDNEIKQIISLSEEINEVSSLIKGISDETKMLGLNASIEAARAGDAGKGFGVVAQEIRKLSEQSRSTVPKIAKLTDNIREKVESSSKMSQNSLTSSQEQAAATQEITASIEEITSMSENLNQIVNKL